MIDQDHKTRVLAKLRTACNELEDALSLAGSPTLHHLVLLPETTHRELTTMVDNLNRMLLQLEGVP